MVQSSAYKLGSSVATKVDVTDNDTRALGDVDVVSLPDNPVFDLLSDSSRQIGKTQVTNTVATELPDNPVFDLLSDSSRQIGKTQVTNTVATELPDNPVFDLLSDSSRQIGKTQVTNTVATEVNNTVATEVNNTVATEVNNTVSTSPATATAVENAAGTTIDPATQQTLAALKDSYEARTANHSGLDYGRTTVDTTNGPMPLNAGNALSPPPNSEVLIQALDNTATVYVGEAGVTDADGHPLQAGQKITLSPDDVSTIHIAGTSDGDEVSWIVESDA